MELISLGEIGITVQNETKANEDIYMISGKDFNDIPGQIESLLADHMEDPERYVLNQEGSSLNIYTKQPDAIIQLAHFLNQKRGIHVNETEIESVREHLIQMQQ
jgi:hypothetical protein